MSKKPYFIESGLVMLVIPAGIMLIVGIVFALFLGARDTPSPHHLSSAQYEQRAE
jgi:hypothetical protein